MLRNEHLSSSKKFINWHTPLSKKNLFQTVLSSTLEKKLILSFHCIFIVENTRIVSIISGKLFYCGTCVYSIPFKWNKTEKINFRYSNNYFHCLLPTYCFESTFLLFQRKSHWNYSWSLLFMYRRACTSVHTFVPYSNFTWSNSLRRMIASISEFSFIAFLCD